MTTMPSRAPRLLLLLKAQKFAGQAGYYLHGGRWHSIKQDKPAPKGAPLAAHPQAAGAHAPVQHLTDAEWAQLKLPDSNVNAGTFNGQLDKLKQHSEAGHVTGILGSGYGTNTYGKKLAAVANHLLGLHGSEHKVVPGQKAGEHPAVQQAPAEPAMSTAAPDTAAQALDVAPADAASQAAPEVAPEVAAQPPEVAPASKNPWTDEQWAQLYLPDSNTNAGSHNKKVAAMQAAAEAGDVAAIQAMKFGVNTYGKKQAKIAEHLVAAMGAAASGGSAASEGGGGSAAAEPKADAEKPAAPAQSLPKAPKFKDFNFELVAKKWHESAAKGDWDALAASAYKLAQSAKDKPHFASDPDVQKLMAYGTELLKVGKPAADTQPKIILPKTRTKPQTLADKVGAAPGSNQVGDMLYEHVTGKGKSPEAFDEAIAAANQHGYADHAANVQKWKDSVHPPAPAEPDFGMFNDLKGDVDVAVNNGDASTLKDIIAYVGSKQNQGEPGAGALHDYAQAALAKITPAAEDSPKEGDTKPGADGGTLVFKDGRWHKQAEPEPEADQHPVDAVPEYQAEGWAASAKGNIKSALQKLKDQIKSGDLSGLKGATKKMASGKHIITLPHPTYAGAKMKAQGFGQGAKDLHAHIEALKAAAGKPAKKKPAPPPPPPPGASSGPEHIDGWKQVGAKQGSNPGGLFQAPDGTKWYCKFPADQDAAKSEVLASKLYEAAGIPVASLKMVQQGGKVGIASKWVGGLSTGSADKLAAAKHTHAGFAVDAWLANWDVVGLSNDNLQLGADGKVVRVDVGGSLEYRAQGAKKAFGNEVTELASLRDPKVNAQAAAVFGKIGEADLTASVARIAKISDEDIQHLVQAFGPGTHAEKAALAATLIARKDDLLAKFPAAAKAAAPKRHDPTKLPVDAAKLPKRHDFSNWNGPGAGLSSKAHVNQANADVEQQMLEIAKSGHLPLLQAFHYQQLDKDTGAPTGQSLPIANHPSKHVVQFHADLVQALDEIANPPKPLKLFRTSDASTVDAISAVFKPKAMGTTVAAVKSNEKLGFWVALGGVSSVAGLKPPQELHFTPAAVAAAHEKFKQAPKLAKHFIQSVQASGSYNDLFRQGKEHDHAGHKLTDVAQAALDYATSQPEGTSLYRWQQMTDEMVKKILSAPDGTVIQATGPMCTSYHPTATQSFGKHRVTIRYAKGAKAVESFGSGGYKGEKEVTTLPNARFVVLSKAMVPDIKSYGGGGQRLELELLMLPPDLGLPGNGK